MIDWMLHTAQKYAAHLAGVSANPATGSAYWACAGAWGRPCHICSEPYVGWLGPGGRWELHARLWHQTCPSTPGHSGWPDSFLLASPLHQVWSSGPPALSQSLGEPATSSRGKELFDGMLPPPLTLLALKCTVLSPHTPLWSC